MLSRPEIVTRDIRVGPRLLCDFCRGEIYIGDAIIRMGAVKSHPECVPPQIKFNDRPEDMGKAVA